MDTSSEGFARVVHDISIVRPWILRYTLTTGLLEHLSTSRSSRSDAAAHIGANERICAQVIDYLVAIGYAEDTSDGTVALTAVGDALKQLPADLYGPGSPMLMFDDAARHISSAWRSGGPVSQRRITPYWNEVALSPEACATIGRYQPRSTQFDGHQLTAIIGSERRSSESSVLDLGGSNGALARDLAATHRGRIGILDLPEMIPNARENLSDLTGHRIDFHGGSFFDPVPDDYEVYVLNAILYDYTDVQIATLLSGLHSSMPHGSVIVISELAVMFSDPYTQAESTLLLSLNTGGRPRSIDDVTQLATAAGFRGPRRVVDSEKRYTLVFDR